MLTQISILFFFQRGTCIDSTRNPGLGFVFVVLLRHAGAGLLPGKGDGQGVLAYQVHAIQEGGRPDEADPRYINSKLLFFSYLHLFSIASE